MVVLATLIPGVLFWMAPGPYREDALPSWETGDEKNGRVLAEFLKGNSY